MREFHVLNLGAGLQSSTLYLLEKRLGNGGDLHFDVAIFADTQAEPKSVYRHVEWLMSLGGPPIWVRTRGSLEQHLMVGQNSKGHRFASIPCYTNTNHEVRLTELAEPDKEGQVRRQCTAEYKIEVIEKTIRRELLGLKPRQHMPKDVLVHQYYGISTDEVRRMGRIRERWSSVPWTRPHFPLIDRGWSRRGCAEWLKDKVPHKTPRSACVFCPFRSDHEWAMLKDDEPEEWERAVKVDRALRQPGNVVNRNMNKSLYLHRSCIPLEMVDFNNLPPQTLEPFTLYDCVGMCGN